MSILKFLNKFREKPKYSKWETILTEKTNWIVADNYITVIQQRTNLETGEVELKKLTEKIL